jgi:iron complex outermembrane receptor protein
LKRAFALFVVLASGAARADSPAASVDVADLPPLPAAQEEPSAAATVLAASAVEEDVVVGAAKREQSLGNVASAVTVISGDRIRRFGYRTVGEAIAAVAGVYLEDDRLVQSVGIRGLNIPGDFNTRILVLIDGATVNEAWGSFAGVGYDTFVSIEDVSRIEVIRGPVSSVYGANAFFGIINIVTRGASETPAAWGSIGVNSINGEVASAGFAAGNVHRQLRGTVQVMNRFGETYDLAGVGQNLSSDGGGQLAASLVGTYDGTFVQVRAYQEKRDSPFAPYDGDVTSAIPYRETNSQVLVEGGHTTEVNDRFSVAIRGYANLYEYTDHINQIGQPAFDDLGDAQTYGAELRGRYELVPKKLGVTAGTEASYDSTYSKSYTEGSATCMPAGQGGAACVPRDFNIEGAYSELDGQPLSWLGFSGGLRYDRNSVIDTQVSPRLALFLSKSEQYGVKLLYADGFRNPSAYEAFFYDGVSFAQAHDLKAETIQSSELVLWAKPVLGMSLRLSGFYWDARNIVEQLQDPVDPMLLQFQNVGRYVSAGVEAEGSYRTASGWYGFGGATYADVGCEQCGAFSTDPTSTAVQYGNVPNAPAIVASGGISTPRLGGLLHVSTELVYIGERPVRPDGNGDELASSPGWLGWNWALYLPGMHGFDLTAGVRNLIGTRDHVVAPGDYDRTDTNTVVPYVLGEGREVYAKVGYHY